MLEGLYEIVPKDLLQIFSEREVELLISGLPDIDVDEWRGATGAFPWHAHSRPNHSLNPLSGARAQTDLVGYSNSDPIVGYFWRAVRSLSQEERAKLLQFVTGSSRVPLEGFGSLQGMQCVARSLLFAVTSRLERLTLASHDRGVTRFNIHKAANNASLPSAHTCFNRASRTCFLSLAHSPSQTGPQRIELTRAHARTSLPPTAHRARPAVRLRVV